MLISLGPRWLQCWHAVDKKCQREANLCCLNHGDGGSVCYWSITSATWTSRYSFLGFFFTLVTFVNPDWHLDLLSTCLTHILSPFPDTLISLPDLPRDYLCYLCFSNRPLVFTACQHSSRMQTSAALALAWHAHLSVPGSHSNPASVSGWEPVSSSGLSQPTSLTHRSNVFPSRQKEINLPFFKTLVCD